MTIMFYKEIPHGLQDYGKMPRTTTTYVRPLTVVVVVFDCEYIWVAQDGISVLCNPDVLVEYRIRFVPLDQNPRSQKNRLKTTTVGQKLEEMLKGLTNWVRRTR